MDGHEYESSSIRSSSYTTHRMCGTQSFYRGQCSCGHTTTSKFPIGISAPVQYGIRATTLVSYLSTYQYMPYKRLCDLMRIGFGLRISEGSIENLLKQSAKCLQPIYDQIAHRIVCSKVVGGDETGMSLHGQKGWMFGFQTPNLTYIKASMTRGFSTISDTFKHGFPQSIYVSDCLPMQLKVKAKKHQICLAHLMRKLKGFIEGHKETEWSPKLNALFLEAWKMKEQEFICKEKIKECEQQLDSISWQTNIPSINKLQAFVKRWKKNRSSIFTFLYHKEVPPDNNATERIIRNVKVKTKVSGFFKSFEGAQRFAVIRSVIDTILKNNQNLFDIFEQIHTTNFDWIGE